MVSSSEWRHEQETTTSSGGAGVVEPDSSRDEGPAETSLESLHLPFWFDRGRLETHLKMLRDIEGSSGCNTVKDMATSRSKLHPQTRAVFKKAENLIKLSPSELLPRYTHTCPT